MRLFGALNSKDRKIVGWGLVLSIALAVAAGFLVPNGNNNENPVPSTYLAGQHGALAAYEMLVRTGYPIERWERPLSELAATAGPGTVVIFAEPFTRELADIKAVRTIIERGGRVLATGFWGGYLLPGESSNTPREFNFAACKLEPEGLDPLASSGEVWMVPEATWQVGRPSDRIEYSCAGQPAVVEYDWKAGHVVWWASSTPLENGSLTRAQNLDFFLNSLGPKDGRHFYWDESLHGEMRTEWNYAGGTALTLLRIGLPVLALLVVFSFSRRSGPVREEAPVMRASPTEFVDALGSLYRNAGASSTAVAIAWDRFQRRTAGLCGLRGQKLNAVDLAAAIRRRFDIKDESLESDLAACADAVNDEAIAPRAALKLVQLLASREAQIREAGTMGANRAHATNKSTFENAAINQEKRQERRS